MYLIARPELQARVLQQLLIDNHIPAQILPLIGTHLNDSALELAIEVANKSEGVIFTSPTVIDVLKNRLALINKNCSFITVGSSSAEYLKKVSQREIIFPKNNSGVRSLISEGILDSISLKELAIFGGDSLNPLLKEYLVGSQINYQFIDLYQRYNLGLVNLHLTRNYLSNDKISGVVITSKLIARFLDDCITELQMRYLRNNLFCISIHPQISDYLCQLGYCNIYETFSADNTAILTLIRKMEYERKLKSNISGPEFPVSTD